MESLSNAAHCPFNPSHNDCHYPEFHWVERAFLAGLGVLIPGIPLFVTRLPIGLDEALEKAGWRFLILLSLYIGLSIFFFWRAFRKQEPSVDHYFFLALSGPAMMLVVGVVFQMVVPG
jgi:hypothetical protein